MTVPSKAGWEGFYAGQPKQELGGRTKMPSFYTVDRLSTLLEGLEIRLAKYDDIRPSELQGHVDALFTDGFTNHGERYFLKNSSDAKLVSPQIELVFEYVRRAAFPAKPSRFQSVFAVGSVVEAQQFRTQYSLAQAPIWQVEADQFFHADMKYLHRGNSVLLWSYFANRYWAGEASKDPFWEFLLIPPVRVLHRVVESDATAAT